MEANCVINKVKMLSPLCKTESVCGVGMNTFTTAPSQAI